MARGKGGQISGKCVDESSGLNLALRKSPEASEKLPVQEDYFKLFNLFLYHVRIVE